ncbi:MAG: XRE family transcriptional regulator [Chrysiogenetes bacterium]|nr:XRE family transcriptional regulator [Chrysiogenetes bacterium]
MPKKIKTRPWHSVRKELLNKDELREIDALVKRDLMEMDLRALRELLGKTQTELAELAEMTQSEISRMERRSDHRLSTLRRVVESLGGELEVIANFGDKSIRLHGAD